MVADEQVMRGGWACLSTILVLLTLRQFNDFHDLTSVSFQNWFLLFSAWLKMHSRVTFGGFTCFNRKKKKRAKNKCETTLWQQRQDVMIELNEDQQHSLLLSDPVFLCVTAQTHCAAVLLNYSTYCQPHLFTSLHHLCPPEPCLASSKTVIHFNILLLTHKAPHGPGPPFQPHGSYSISTSLKCNVLFTRLPEWQLRTQRWAVQRWKGSWRSGRFVSARDRVCHNQEEPPTSTSRKKKVN